MRKRKSRPPGPGDLPSERPARGSIAPSAPSVPSEPPPPEDVLGRAVWEARRAPEDDARWDAAEEVARTSDDPDPVAAAYRLALRSDLPPATLARLGQRAMRFHDEWFEDAGPLADVLTRVIEVDPSAQWAFDRLVMLFTTSSRWDDLLALYDRVVDAEPDKARRIQLLDEAAHVAKDFAGKPDRAIDYLLRLLPLKPNDAQLATSLERLLDRQKRHRDLIELWTSRVAVLPRDGKLAMRAKIAGAWLDKLALPREALAAIEALIPDDPHDTYVPKLLERLVVAPGVERDVVRRAIALLKERYVRAKRGEDVVRVLRIALDTPDRDEKIAVHGEIAARLVELGREVEAIDDCAAVVVLDPGSLEARGRLRELSTSTGRQDRYAEALTRAADATDDDATRLTLWTEAARVRGEVLGDEPEAIALYGKALALSSDPALSLDVARRLATLLESAGRSKEQLDVLDRLATLEQEPAERRGVLGRSARLADRLGDPDRALVAWAAILERDPDDTEALDATIEVLDRVQNWGALLEALRRRAATADDPSAQRRDRMRIARVQSERLRAVDDAIATWEALADELGPDAESVDALDALFTASERWTDVAALLATSSEVEGEPARRADLLRRLGDVRRERLAMPARAVESYAAALALVPAHAGAREGLVALLSDAIDDASDLTAAESLAGAYRSTDEWAKMLSIVEHRVRVAKDDRSRSEVLRETATIEETRAGDARAALSTLCRALPYAPHDVSLEHEVHRLAAATGDWPQAVSALGRAIVAAGDDVDRASSLRLAQGAMLEQQLGDGAGALAAYGPILVAHPDALDAAEAMVRVGARIGAWESVAKTFVESAKGRGRLDYALVAALESAAPDAAGWDALTDALTREVGAASLADATSRELETQIGLWHRDRRHDLDAAERALVRATTAPGADAATLRMLAVLQRNHPGPPLLDTLLRLADASSDDLGILYEAANVALDDVADAERGAQILERLLSGASVRWTAQHSMPTLPPQSIPASVRGDGQTPSAEGIAGWALERLVQLETGRGEHGRAVSLLVEHARLPFPADVSRALIHRAAELATERLDDPDQAIALYGRLLADVPDDRRALTRLGALHRATGRLAELVALRRTELDLAQTIDERLAIRLDLAAVLGAMGDADAQLEGLLANLAERSGHEASIAAVVALLEATSAHDALAKILSEQALRLETEEQGVAAAALWTRVATLAEERLDDPTRAIESWRRVVALDESDLALDALARLHARRGENAIAIEWLERRLARTPPTERARTVVSLAREHLAMGNRDRALSTLEGSLAEDPSAHEVRALLAAIHRETQAWEPLARLLTEGTAHTVDPAVRLAYLREAAEIHQRRLSAADRAIPLFEEATRLAPGDRSVRVALAEALRLGGRLDEARALLDAIVEEFGRRRPPERALVHLQLAQVAEARGDLTEALAQLEAASSIDLAHVGTLRLLGALAKRAHDLPRAEKAYRTLLMQVRRPAMAIEAGIGPAEVLVELYRIATEQQLPDQAHEMLESAFDAATQGEDDAARLAQILRGAGEEELLLRALQTRLATVQDPRRVADVLAEISAVSEKLGRVDDAMDAVVRALDQMPTSPALHDAARALSVRTGRAARYAEILEDLAERAASGDDPRGAAALSFRLGELYEHDLADPARAAAAYERAEAAGERTADAWRALDRVYAALGDARGQARVLRAMVQGPEDDAASKTDALYRLAALELADPARRGDALDALSWAIDRDPQLERAAALLRERRDGDPRTVALFERVARAAGESSWLLDALERRAALEGDDAPPNELLREAVELATRVGATERAELLLLRAIALAPTREAGPGEAVWAHLALAERRKGSGDHAGAVDSLRDAAAAAGESGDAIGYLLEAAALAAGPAADLPLAAELYEQLRRRDPGDRNVWAPLLEVHRKLGDRARVEALIAETIDNVFDAGERNLLRVERVRLLLDEPARLDEAIAALREIVDEDPDEREAGKLLADVLERAGRNDELADVLSRQLDGARARNDVEAIATLSLRLGALLEAERRDEAMDVYRAASHAAPTHREVLAALVRLFKPTDDANDRAETMERLLALEQGERALALGLELAKVRESLHDEDGVVRALERAFHAAPQNDKVRTRLEKLHTDRGDFARLADLVADDAAARKDKRVAVARFREAAKIRQERLGDAPGAAETLRRARALMPDDVALLLEIARALAAAGRAPSAIDELGSALAEARLPDAARAQVLRLRAELRAQGGDDAGTVDDLEAAFALAGKAIAADLAAALDRVRLAARARDDRDAERATTMRLLDVLTAGDDGERAHDVLLDWIARAPDDRPALQRLAAHDAAAGRWDGVVEAHRRLVAIERGEAQVAAALALADAAERAGTPDLARDGLEEAARGNPTDVTLRAALRKIYEAIGAQQELAHLALADAESATDDAQRFDKLLEAGDRLLQAGDLSAALDPLVRALALRPAHHDATLLLADAYTMNGQLDDAMAVLQPAIERLKGKRTKEAAALMHRMARAANAGGGHEVEMQWLQKALDCDMQNGQVASELAEVAMELKHWDVALKALKAVTLLKTPGPMSKAMANLRQGMIAQIQGDARRAVVLAKTALQQDPKLTEAADFLRSLATPG